MPQMEFDMTAWTPTSRNDHAHASLARQALGHALPKLPRLSIVSGLTALAAAVVLWVAMGAAAVPELGLAAAGILAVAAGIALRPSHEPAPIQAPPLTGIVRTGSISSDVVLDYDRGTAEKVYRPTLPVKALYALSFQSRFPYT